MVFIANNTAVISGYCEAVLFERALASSLDRNWSSKNVLVRILAASIDAWVVC